MKGKKFDAHEKHFKEKERKLNKEMKQRRDEYTELAIKHNDLTIENEKLKSENSDIKSKYEKLLELSKLSDGDIKEAINNARSLNHISTIIKSMNNLFH